MIQHLDLISNLQEISGTVEHVKSHHKDVVGKSRTAEGGGEGGKEEIYFKNY